MTRRLALLGGTALACALAGGAITAGTGSAARLAPTPVATAGTGVSVGAGASAGVGVNAGATPNPTAAGGVVAGATATVGGSAGATGSTSGTTGTTGSAGATGSVGATGSAGASSSTTGIFSPTNRPGVVPGNATEVGRTQMAGGATLVTYVSGGLYYNVTYFPSGRYTYTTSGTPLATGGSTGVSGSTTTSTGTTGSTTTSSNGTAAGGAGVSGLPTTGGGGEPSSPALPALVGLGLAAAGLTVRRLTRK